MDADARAAELARLAVEWEGCRDCGLAATRTTVVVGDGDPQARLMFVGEAPGFHEDRRGIPFVGQAGQLLDALLAGIGLTRADCYIANVLKCRPPQNRDPLPEEIEACRGKLARQVELIAPSVVCTLGNFATKLLSGRDLGVTRVHGRARRALVGPHEVVLYPLYHPAAALYNARLRPELEADFARIPDLLRHLEGLGASEPPPAVAAAPSLAPAAPATTAPGAPDDAHDGQLGLF
jgi:uracil-DNA glycosylase family 4